MKYNPFNPNSVVSTNLFLLKIKLRMKKKKKHEIQF